VAGSPEGIPEAPAGRRTGITTQLRKTKICLYHMKGVCQYGNECAFAHSCRELQAVPDLRKTRICQNFMEGSCEDPSCTFAHGEEELRSTDFFFKKTMCIWFLKGKCRNGDRCRFAHGQTELRAADEVPAIAGMTAAATQGGRRRGRQAGRRPTEVEATPPIDAAQNEPMKVVSPMFSALLQASGQELQELQWAPRDARFEEKQALEANIEHLRRDISNLTMKYSRIQQQMGERSNPGFGLGGAEMSVAELFNLSTAVIDPGSGTINMAALSAAAGAGSGHSVSWPSIWGA